jgi:hypothetical protein
MESSFLHVFSQPDSTFIYFSYAYPYFMEEYIFSSVHPQDSLQVSSKKAKFTEGKKIYCLIKIS